MIPPEEDLWLDQGERQLSQAHQQLLCSSAEEKFSVFDPSRALRDLKHAVQQEHVWEVCCSPESSLTKEARRQGFCATRWSWESGFDLGSAAKVDQMISQIPRMKPTRVWASPKCTSSIQNLTHQTDQQRFELQKKRMRTRREIRHLIRMFKAAYSRKPGHVELYMECPKSATYCWRMKEWEDFRSWMMINHGQPLYWTEIHGCMFGLKSETGKLLNKSWYVLTTDYEFSMAATVKCDGSHEHQHVIGLGTGAVHSTSYYPQRMVERIVQIWKKKWHHVSQSELLKEIYVKMSQDPLYIKLMEECDSFQHESAMPLATEQLSTTPPASSRLEKNEEQHQQQNEEVTTKQREQARAMLHKLHKAAGHPPNRNLVKLCKDRKLPPWVIEEAKNLQCQACVDTQRGAQRIIPRSLGDVARPWQFVAMDAFELPFPAMNLKARYLLFVCTTTHFMTIAMTWKGDLNNSGTDSGQKVIDTFTSHWLMHRPRPQWIVMDSQTSFAQGIFPQFLEMVGIGSMVTAGEAHWQNGIAETLIGSAKRTMRRIRNEDLTLSPEVVGSLTAHAHNHTDRCKGFSPV